MPIDPDVAIGAQLPDRTFSWESSRRAALPPRHRRRVPARATTWTRRRCATPSTATTSRCCPASASWRRRSTRPTRRRSTCPAATSTCPRSCTAARRSQVDRPAADVRLGDAAHADHRRLGQGQGGRDLAGGRGHVAPRATRCGRCGRRSSCAGEGGWGGDRGASPKVELPDREPDCDASYDVTPQQALLYRLCGDRNPLHADPDFAKAAGFPAPILHGLCSYGIVLRTRHRRAARRRRRQGRAASPRASPAWSSRARRSGCAAGTRTSGSSSRRAIAGEGERDGAPVLADCVLTPPEGHRDVGSYPGLTSRRVRQRHLTCHHRQTHVAPNPATSMVVITPK